MSAPIERELKLVLPSRSDFEALLAQMLNQAGASCTRCSLQHNLFFDHLRGDAAPERGSALRLRQESLFRTDDPVALAALRFDFPNAGGRFLTESAVSSPIFEKTAWELTFKRGKSNQAGYFQATEWNCALEPETARLFSPEMADVGQAGLVEVESMPSGLEPLEQFQSLFGSQPLRSLGGFHNLRTTLQYDDFCFEFDQTFYAARGNRDCDLEIEVETEQPEGALRRLAGLWDSPVLPWQMQSKTKFQRFLEFRTA